MVFGTIRITADSMPIAAPTLSPREAPARRRPALRVFLPPGWVERESKAHRRVYQADKGETGGWLVLSAMPPLDATEGEPLDYRLCELIDDPKEPTRGVWLGHSTLGRLVTTTFADEHGNSAQIWIAAGVKGTVFATYLRPDAKLAPFTPEGADAERADAQAIVESVDLEANESARSSAAT